MESTIAELRRKQYQLESERTQLSTIVEATPDIVASFTPGGALRYLNAAGRSFYGLKKNEDIGRYTRKDLFPERMAQQFNTEILPTIQREGSWMGDTYLNSPSGLEKPVSLVVLSHLNTDGDIDQVSIIARDISERIRLESALEHGSMHDSITGLPNRLFLVNHFESALKRARITGSNLGILFLDLNSFRRINESLGHAAGNILLHEVARLLRACLRPTDIIARTGGDEFVVLAGDLAIPENMNNLMYRLRAAFEKPILVSSHQVYITFSAGIAWYPQHGDRVEDLLRYADTAMCHAKKFGPNQHSIYTPDMNSRTSEMLSLEGDLKRSLNRKELFLHYQPQIDLKSGRINNVEALLRWHHPDQGIIPPDIFIPLLENTGMIIPVGEWVLHQACNTLRSWREAGLENFRIGVNVSAAQFNNSHFVDQVRHIIIEEKISPHDLVLEITENIIMSDMDKAADILKTLTGCGIRIAIDDFGTGYSSFSYLKRFSPHELKIDQTFIRDLVPEKNDAAIVEASIILGQKLGMEVIAEGVETADQHNFLLDKGCDSAQGFYFSCPLLAADLMDLLQRNRKLTG